MADTYYIRRGGDLFGPVNGEQLRQHVASGQIVDTDEVAESVDGPWHPLSAALGEASHGSASHGEAPQAAGQHAAGGDGGGYNAVSETPPTTIGGSEVRIAGQPSFAHIRIDLGPGETMIGEADAMASMAGEMDLQARLNGGFFSGLSKKFLGGRVVVCQRIHQQHGAAASPRAGPQHPRRHSTANA